MGNAGAGIFPSDKFIEGSAGTFGSCGIEGKGGITGMVGTGRSGTGIFTGNGTSTILIMVMLTQLP